MNQNDKQRRIEIIAQEISRYVRTRPDAAETAEGVARWWIARQRMEEPVAIVEEALELLVRRAELVKRETEGDTLYLSAQRTT